jgi:hypothetical protein
MPSGVNAVRAARDADSVEAANSTQGHDSGGDGAANLKHEVSPWLVVINTQRHDPARERGRPETVRWGVN